ncbi:MAG: AMP-binding protein [Gammaproteobacteria bacterium]|nr:AMP-binding protein [Gammaproteobacteria bacterium]
MEKIWFKSYPADVPHEIDPDYYPSLVELFLTSCKKYHNLPAFSNMGTSLSYGQLDKLTRDFAAYLQQELKLKKGDRFAIMLPNLLQYPVALFGALRAGLIVVNVNPLYTPRELIHQLNDAGVSTLLVLENFAHTVEASQPSLSLKHILITKVGDLFPFLKASLVNFALKYVKKAIKPYSLPTLSFKHALLAGSHCQFEPVSVSGTDIAVLQYTGGTTGVAKGAMLTHRNLVANVMQNTAWISPFMKAGQEVIITAIPLYHIFSLTANCLTFLAMGALDVLITNPKDIPGFVKFISKIKFSTFTGVNTLFNALLNNSQFKQCDFSRMRLTLGGGMAVKKSVAERWQAVTGKPLLEAYGLTETSPAVTINPLNLHSFNGTVGLPVPSTDISVRDDNNQELGVNQIGELWVRGPQVMRGYWNNPEETAKVFMPDGWLKTGDIAQITEKGFVKLIDRKKEMILVSGFNVYPNEVEEVLSAHPKILEVGVVGVPDAQSGEAIKAFIVKKDPSLTKEEILRFCREQLTGYKIPHRIEFRDQLPKTPVGKILRRELAHL